MNNSEFSSRVLSRKERMYRLAKGILCDVAEAEDAVQDVLERLWVKRAALSGYVNLDAFILTSVKNACLDWIRSRKLREGRKEAVAARYETVEDPRRMQDVTDMKVLAEKVISTLPEKQRMVIHLRDVEGMKMNEIAVVMEVGEDVLRVYLSRARKAVREELIKLMNYGLRE